MARTVNLFSQALGLVLGCSVVGYAAAQTFKDPALEALFAADKTAELQRTSAARVATQADDAQAVLGVAMAALEGDDAAARKLAIQRAEACIDKQPKAAACHYAHGVVLGVQAMSEGMFKMARSAGTVKEALTLAQALDPDWYPARSALVEFHLVAPGMMGGSAAKAAELAKTAPRPEQVKLLEARVALVEKKFESALQALLALASKTPRLDSAMAGDATGWAVQAGLGLVNDKQAAKAAPLLETLLRELPDQSGPAYALGRARGELGAHEVALKLYEQALALKGAGAWPLHYRIGFELQALGRNDDAKAAYKRHVAAGKGSANLITEAKKRLEQLGG
jgi:tetratricopeptide (TPR) repeat protein